MQNNPENQTRPGKSSTDEVSRLRQQLGALVAQVRCTIAHAARPEGLKEVLAQSQEMLR
jgi:hypothetical protein